jgi:hypothetical protein
MIDPLTGFPFKILKRKIVLPIFIKEELSDSEK